MPAESQPFYVTELERPDRNPRRIRGRSPKRARSVGAGVLLAALPLTFAAGQVTRAGLGPLPGSAAHLREDLALALSIDSAAARSRRAQVERARQGLDAARLGFDMTFEAEPEAEVERDLLDGTTGWEAGLDLSLGAELSRDADRVLRAEAALAAAQAGLRAQKRADQRAAILAMSDVRIGETDVEDAAADALVATTALESARAAGSGPDELRRLELEAALADVELRRERAAHAARLARVAALETAPTQVCQAGLLTGPLAAAVESPPEHSGATRLRIALARAELAWRNLPFESVREVELTGAYEEGGAELTAEVGLYEGVPSVAAGLGWASGGTPGHSLALGLSAVITFSADSPSRTTLVSEELEDARRELAAFTAAQPARESAALGMLELAYEEMALLIKASDAAALAVASETGPAERERLEDAAERARGQAERAWQRYVRALFDYLEEVDAVLTAPPCDVSGVQKNRMRWS